MARGKRERKLLALTGAAALAAVAVNLVISAVNAHKERRMMTKKKKDLLGSNVRVNLSASEILWLADQIIIKSKETYDLVASVPIDEISYHTVISPLAELEAKQFPLVQSCIFPKMVAASDDVRRASAEAEKKLDSHFLMCRKREDVYGVIKAFLGKGEWVNPEVKRFVKCLVRDFERNGVNLNPAKRKEVESLKCQLNDLSLQYIENLKKNTHFLLFNESELAGMPLEFIKSLEKSENGMLKVFLTTNHVSPILEHCKDGATRKLVAVTHGQRCGEENMHILENLVQVRHKFAAMLGYSSYAEYAIEPRMAKTSSKVFDFLEDISVNLTDLATRELTLLKELKQKEEGISSFGVEDMLYYMKRAEEQYFDVEVGQLDQLFPVTSVLSGIFKIYQDIFGLLFEEINDIEVWHDTVRLFSVSDSSSHELLGYFYIDLFSREGKYAHMCVLALQNGYLLSNGARQMPIALIISQFPKQIDSNPVLLRFSEVVSLFHEFGHVVHQMCNRASFARFSGLQIEADFLEIPSQLLENWCYERKSLDLMSGSSQGHSIFITSEMCKQLKRRRDSFTGLKLKQEILLCLVDLIIHSGDNVDVTELVKDLHRKVMLGIPFLEGTNPASCFPRLAIGFEAVCYSYIWSEVFATDIFQSKFQDDLLNKYTGLQFRNKVFALGGAKDPSEILTDYLGREPSIMAFIETKSRNSLGYYI